MCMAQHSVGFVLFHKKGIRNDLLYRPQLSPAELMALKMTMVHLRPILSATGAPRMQPKIWPTTRTQPTIFETKILLIR